MRRNDVGLIDATGGPGAVKAAHSSGKPALGVGAGNTPVCLDKSAKLDMAVVGIITSKTFDNGMICASEQTVVIDDEICDNMQPMAVGQKATNIAHFGGIKVEPKTKLLITPIKGVGPRSSLSMEALFPLLSVYRAKSVGPEAALTTGRPPAGESPGPRFALRFRQAGAPGRVAGARQTLHEG